MDYIIVQAGGKGTRLEFLTSNKPKALTPVDNLPMLFHLFRKYPDKRFVIIADYKKSVLRKYLDSFADVIYQVVDAKGTGTASGIKQALSLIPPREAFMLVWSDLILPQGLKLPEEYEKSRQSVEKNYIGISSTFPCRWKYENGLFWEERSAEHGVAGFFLFRSKEILEDVPENGELVKWMQGRKMHFEMLSLAGTKEFGLLEEYEKLAPLRSRPFNQITVEGEVLSKKPVDAQGKQLAYREYAWYEFARANHIREIPQIFGADPLKMEFIHGRNIFECNFSSEEKRIVLERLVQILKSLHEAGHIPADSFSVKEAYFRKTMRRLAKIEDLVPFAREHYINVNGRKCRNVFFYRDRLEAAIDSLKCQQFAFIHGDCTFSNLMLRENGEAVLIDPRGYFGYTEFYGDERYDWAKLYYSLVGNYDRFNLKKFHLEIGGSEGSRDTRLQENEVELSIESNGWEMLEDLFFELTGADRYEIKLLHAVIWLSLTTYAWQDYDSVCGAFYNGLYYLEEVL